MKAYTDIKTLKKAWELLKELELQSLLSGEEVKVNVIHTLDRLLEEGKLNEFCQIITKSDTDFEGIELAEVAKVVSGFFDSIAGSLKGLIPAGATVSAGETKREG